MARRVVIPGFGGLDPRLCRRHMAAGDLPHFTELAAAGGFRELATSVPCQSPVAWRTMMTGVNPGVHGVFDFLKRRAGTYLPELATAGKVSVPLPAEDWKRVALSPGAGLAGAAGALAALGKFKDKPISRRGFFSACLGLPVAAAGAGALFNWLPREVPRAENRSGGEPFWAALGRAGARTTAFQGVDWANTYAYSTGLGQIYLNREGREPLGLVRPGAMAGAVKDKLREGLSAWRDDGAPIIRTLHDGARTFAGARAADAADFVVGFAPGYRVSWQTSLGGTPPELPEDNRNPWNNDHCSLDPAVTPGVLFSNRPLKRNAKGTSHELRAAEAGTPVPRRGPRAERPAGGGRAARQAHARGTGQRHRRDPPRRRLGEHPRRGALRADLALSY